MDLAEARQSYIDARWAAPLRQQVAFACPEIGKARIHMLAELVLAELGRRSTA